MMRASLVDRCGGAAVLLLLCACAPPLTVALEQVHPGDAVRVTYAARGDSPVDYRLLRHVDGSLEVSLRDAPAPHRVRILELERLEVVRGRDLRRSGFLGFVAGGLVGLVGGMVCFEACPQTERGRRILAPVVGLGIGAPIGTAAGALLAPKQWVDVRIR